MKIKQVEELVGITQKNIRFYEDQGLIRINRTENGYRDYSLEDVKRLYSIKLLRMISVPIEDIRLLFSHEESLQNVLDKQAVYLNTQRDNMEKMGVFCRMLSEQNLSIDTLDAENCLETIEMLQKEGMQFMDIKNTDVHRQKKMGALLGFGIMAILLLFWIGAVVYARVTEEMPTWIFIIMISIPISMIIGLAVAVIQRNREIEGGEEDEASKY